MNATVRSGEEALSVRAEALAKVKAEAVVKAKALEATAERLLWLSQKLVSVENPQWDGFVAVEIERSMVDAKSVMDEFEEVIGRLRITEAACSAHSLMFGGPEAAGSLEVIL